MRSIALALLASLLLTPVGHAGPPCISDTNGDGTTDVVDLVTVINAWGTDDPIADVNFDGIVDVLDLTEIIVGWGPCLPPPSVRAVCPTDRASRPSRPSASRCCAVTSPASASSATRSSASRSCPCRSSGSSSTTRATPSPPSGRDPGDGTNQPVPQNVAGNWPDNRVLIAQLAVTPDGDPFDVRLTGSMGLTVQTGGEFQEIAARIVGCE
jgi:hypothetical protein